MIPYPYNMVDMGGIDLAEANGTVVDGLYAKIVEAVNACGDVVLYNWKFAGIEISPQHTSILVGDPIIISGAVQVTAQDEVTVPGINPEPPPTPVIIPLSVNENGEYLAADFNADGFDPINVSTPSPVIAPLEATENRIYMPPSGVDGFAPVEVNVSGGSGVIFVDSEYSTSGVFSYDKAVTILNDGDYDVYVQMFVNFTHTVKINGINVQPTTSYSGYFVYLWNFSQSFSSGDSIRIEASSTGNPMITAVVKASDS